VLEISLTPKTVQETHLDPGKSGPSLGDRRVFADDLLEDDD
jgi:hypothetical protein